MNEIYKFSNYQISWVNWPIWAKKTERIQRRGEENNNWRKKNTHHAAKSKNTQNENKIYRKKSTRQIVDEANDRLPIDRIGKCHSNINKFWLFILLLAIFYVMQTVLLLFLFPFCLFLHISFVRFLIIVQLSYLLVSILRITKKNWLFPMSFTTL